MNKKILASLSLLAMSALMSCSDSSGGAGGGGLTSLPAIEGAPEQSTLTSNNSVAATPAQISEDLQTLAGLNEMGSLMSDIDLSSPLGGFGAAGVVKSNVALARKNIVAWGACEAYPSTDTTYVEDGMTMTETMKVLDSKGKALQICEPETQAEAESMMSQMDGMQMVMHISGKSDTMDMEMNMNMVVNLSGSGENMAMGMSAQANFLIDVKIPKAFNVYMELDMDMPSTAMSSETEPDFDFSMIMWFQNGRYKCEVDYDVLSSEATDAKVCDLMNAGKAVGSLWNDENGEMQVRDGAGNILDPEAAIVDGELQ